MKQKHILSNEGPLIIGMVHCLPLPGTKDFADDVNKIIDQAILDAKTMERAGVDALIVENMGDVPLQEKLDIAQIAALSAVTARVRDAVDLPIGINAAFNDYEAALSIAKINNASFIRLPVFVDTIVFSDGIIEPCARRAVTYRKQIGAEHVKIMADVQVKHSHMLVAGIPIEESAKTAVASGADMIIVTGKATGEETPIDQIRRVKRVVDVPIIVGSGVKKENIKDQLSIADGAIIGTSIKKDGYLRNPVSFELAKSLIEAFKGKEAV